jgi:hypothetical protein
MSRPKGSGWFAAIFGAVFLTAFICSFIWDLSKISPQVLFKIWLLFAASVLLGWGINRIRKGSDGSAIGQSTINFVIAIIGATFAILAILIEVKN